MVKKKKKGTDSGESTFGFKSLIYTLNSYVILGNLTSPSLIFFICKMGI